MWDYAATAKVGWFRNGLPNPISRVDKKEGESSYSPLHQCHSASKPQSPMSFSPASSKGAPKLSGLGAAESMNLNELQDSSTTTLPKLTFLSALHGSHPAQQVQQALAMSPDMAQSLAVGFGSPPPPSFDTFHTAASLQKCSHSPVRRCANATGLATQRVSRS